VRPLLLCALLFAGIAVDGAWLSRVPMGLAPDIVILVLLSAAVRGGLATGALLGAAAGYLRDVAGGTPLGVYTFAYLVVGIAAGSMMTLLDFDQRFVPAMTAAGATLLVSIVTGAVVAATGLASVAWLDLMASAAMVAGINAALARPMDALVQGVERAARRRHPSKPIAYRVLR
jgi:rod shape-determining protein MreD